MKHNPNETYEEWAKRVDMFERGYALQRLANGEPAEKVIDDMGRRIMEKLLHPILKTIHNSVDITLDLEASKKHYEENYIKKFGPKADHVVEEKIDKDE
jgi:glutamyl-tRNA reductase